jgi:GNAT superfamily N-acetyltransferase
MSSVNTFSKAQLQILPLAPLHADEAARLHILGQPGTFLTALGPDVLSVLYRVLPVSPVGFGYAATDDSGSLLAFAAITTSTGRLFVEMGTKRLPALLPPLLARFVQQPSLLLRSVQTLFYPFMAGAEEDREKKSVTAELLAIMTAPSHRGQGIGSMLIAQVVDACRRRGITTLDVTVDAANHGARRFYTEHGFVLRHEIHLYGRTMCLYRRGIVAP